MERDHVSLGTEWSESDGLLQGVRHSVYDVSVLAVSAKGSGEK